MILSMTGFGKASAESNHKKFTVEIKSLNSKQLDLTCRYPSAYREIEVETRNRLLADVQRGKVEVSLTVEHLGDAPETSLNVERLAAYKSQVEEMSRRLGIPAPADWYNVLLRFPEAFHTDAADAIPDDDREAILAALDEAVKRLTEFRAKEGVKLEAFFTRRLDTIGELLAEVLQYERERIVKIRARIEESLAEIPRVEYDRGRLEQEMIFYIEKLDITEEKQRLRQHLDYFAETMKAQPGQGKKLGFISQEMGREINTLGSKSNQADMQILVVKMKDELEQIKEQVLNAL